MEGGWRGGRGDSMQKVQASRLQYMYSGAIESREHSLGEQEADGGM